MHIHVLMPACIFMTSLMDACMHTCTMRAYVHICYMYTHNTPASSVLMYILCVCTCTNVECQYRYMVLVHTDNYVTKPCMRTLLWLWGFLVLVVKFEVATQMDRQIYTVWALLTNLPQTQNKSKSSPPASNPIVGHHSVRSTLLIEAHLYCKASSRLKTFCDRSTSRSGAAYTLD